MLWYLMLILSVKVIPFESTFLVKYKWPSEFRKIVIHKFYGDFKYVLKFSHVKVFTNFRGVLQRFQSQIFKMLTDATEI